MSTWSIQKLIDTTRRSAAVINGLGSHAIYTATSYDLAEKKKTANVNILNLKTRKEDVVQDASAPVLTSDSEFVYFAGKTLKKHDFIKQQNSIVKQFDRAIDDLSACGNVLAYSAKVQETEEGDCLEYDSLYVRHWDSWKHDRSAIFTLMNDVETNVSGELSVLAPPNGADLSVSDKHVAFVAKDPDLNEAWNTASQVWLVGVDGTNLHRINTTKGASSSPAFNADGSKLAYLEMRVPGYEADRNRIVVYDLEKKSHKEIDWDMSPSSVQWDGENLYSVAVKHGVSNIYKDQQFLCKGSSISIAKGRSLVSSSSFARQMTYHLDGAELMGEQEGLSDTSTSDFWFDSHGRRVHGWIIKPNNFDASKSYPMIFLIHGGPQSAWTDSWSTRWNPSTMANHGDGYVCVAINPTGSTSYGQQFCDDIQGNWGSLPYDDLVAGFEVVSKYSYIDADRCVAAGASYGGYMINWIQGHDFARKFKAFVCHDGIFNTFNTYYHTEELFFPERDFKGLPWESKEYERWNPMNYVEKWETPQLVIHSSRDYRIPETEGLAAFTALQRRGIESKLLIFKTENHWVLKPENSKRWYDTVMAWMDRHTRPSSSLGCS